MAEAKTATKKAAPKAVKAPKKASKEVSKDFAVIMTGGKQYIVRPGQNLKIEKILGDNKEGDSIKFDQVLLSTNGDDLNIGSPFLPKGVVMATIKKISRYKTVDVIKYKQKSRYFKKYGHRQPYFEVQIDSIA